VVHSIADVDRHFLRGLLARLVVQLRRVEIVALLPQLPAPLQTTTIDVAIMDNTEDWQPEVVARFRWTADDLIQARSYHRKQSMRRPFRLALYLAALLFLGLGAIGLTNPRLEGSLVFGGLVLAGLWILLSQTLLISWISRYQFSKRPDQNKEVEWQFGQEAVAIITDQSNSELSWSMFSKALQCPSGLMLYPNDQIFHWIPRHGFSSDADFERSCTLARAKVARYYEVA
jgi:hypothetical protein